MPPKAAEKKPTTGGKAPAGKAPAEKKEAGKKTAAPAGEKKKRNKTRKETYSSYIYKGMFHFDLSPNRVLWVVWPSPVPYLNVPTLGIGISLTRLIQS